MILQMSSAAWTQVRRLPWLEPIVFIRHFAGFFHSDLGWSL